MNKSFMHPNAVAVIHGGAELPELYGEVLFYQHQNHVLVEANIKGLPLNGSGFFGFHIHEGISCTGTDFADTMNHYNPKDLPHPLHAGDLPPLLRYNGNAYMKVATDRFDVSDIIGRTVVIHDMADDFNSQPSGNSGKKIACGMIKSI